MKNAIKKIIPLLLFILSISLLYGCNNSNDKKLQNEFDELQDKVNNIYDKLTKEDVSNLDYSNIAYEKIKYIDSVLHDRDCFNGENFKLTQNWINWLAIKAGYKNEEITYQNVLVDRYVNKTTDLNKSFSAATNINTDGKYYTRNGRSYVEDENGNYLKVSVSTPNIIITKKGKTNKQIIVGAHYDGTGTGDNGSGIALALTTLEQFHDIETTYTIQFVFFTAEEYGCYGSTYYANQLSEEEVNNTLYMINMDSLVCGDYCYLYGGVQDDENKTVNDTIAFDNAMNLATNLGLSFKQNPWTWDNPAPGYDTPDYASPSTGDWSDHVGFKKRGIPYLYMEATNWEIPGPYKEYDGYGETMLVGMLMNTENDYLEYIEKYFPRRIQEHLSQFSQLLNALLMQDDFNNTK